MKKRRRTKREAAMEYFAMGKPIEEVEQLTGLTHSGARYYQREYLTEKRWAAREKKQRPKQRFFGSGVIFCGSTDTGTIWRC